MSTEFFPAKIQLEVIKSRRRAVSVGQKRQWMNERVSFEIKRKSPPAPPFSSLHQSQLYPLSPLLSFIITARDFIPAFEAAGSERPGVAREKKRKQRRDGCARVRWRAQSTFGTEITVKLSAGDGRRSPGGKKKLSNPSELY